MGINENGLSIMRGAGQRARQALDVGGNAIISGKVGIGTVNATYNLTVNGTIRCKQLIVDSDWADFVFDNNYSVPPLREVKQYIQEKGHLPGIPTEKEIQENGVSIGKVTSKLLQKIEELTLYVIDLKDENEFLKARLSKIELELRKNSNSK